MPNATTKTKAAPEKEAAAEKWYILEINLENLVLQLETIEQEIHPRTGVMQTVSNEVVAKFDCGLLDTSDKELVERLDKRVGNEGPAHKRFRECSKREIEYIKGWMKKGVNRREWHDRLTKIRNAAGAAL